MIGGAAAPNVTVLYVFRLIQGFGLGALLVVLFAAFTEYVLVRTVVYGLLETHSSVTLLIQSVMVSH